MSIIKMCKHTWPIFPSELSLADAPSASLNTKLPLQDVWSIFVWIGLIPAGKRPVLLFTFPLLCKQAIFSQAVASSYRLQNIMMSQSG